MASTTSLTATAIRHPDFLFDSTEWAEWRETFKGGKNYRERFLKKWSSRESTSDFTLRKFCTPIPAFAKAAILDIRNSIFQRLGDVSRTGGSQTYRKAIAGEAAGVDREGASMNTFIGIDLLTELLVMGRAGVYVDAPNLRPTTLAQQNMMDPALGPYCYVYRIEDILSWTLDEHETPGTFKAVLLRDHVIKYNVEFAGIPLPQGRETRLRLVWKDDATGKVRVKMFTDEPKQADRRIIELANADPDGAVTLDLDIVPFVMPDIGDSLMADISTYQHALLNLVSGDVNWQLQSSSPFLTIQRDLRSTGAHLKQPGQGNTPESGGQRAKDNEEQIGGKGRYYDKDMERPDYIAPPTDPLLASMKLQEKLEDDIRKLVNLAVANKVGSRTESAESKKLSSEGLEAGLSFIGLVLEHTEQLVARYWAMYERGEESAKVTYPERYILKQDIDRILEAKELVELMDHIPTKRGRKAVAKKIVMILLGGQETSESIDAILSEIEKAGFTTGKIEEIIQAHTAGLVSDETASDAVGFDGKKEVDQARKDKAERATITLMAQTAVAGQSGNAAVAAAGARGVPEIDVDEDSAKEEKAEAKEEKANA